MTHRIAFQRALVKRKLRDTCRILRYQGGTRNQYGYVGASYTPGSPILCHYNPTESREIQISTTQVATADGVIYLATSNSVSSKDRLQVTHLNGDGTVSSGEALSTPLTLQVVGIPEIQQTLLAVAVSTVLEGTP